MNKQANEYFIYAVCNQFRMYVQKRKKEREASHKL